MRHEPKWLGTLRAPEVRGRYTEVTPDQKELTDGCSEWKVPKRTC